MPTLILSKFSWVIFSSHAASGNRHSAATRTRTRRVMRVMAGLRVGESMIQDRGRSGCRALAGPAGEHAEECLDIGVGSGVAVAVEVRRPTSRAAGSGETGEKGFDVPVGSDVAVAIEVRGVHAKVRGGS